MENLGDHVKQTIWGEHVWKKGEVLGTEAMEEAYQAGQRIGFQSEVNQRLPF